MPGRHPGWGPRPGTPATGLRAISRRRAGRYAYTHADRGRSIRADVVVAHQSYRHARTGRRHARKLLFVAWRVADDPVAARDLDRQRFGTESSYRQVREARPRTPSPDGVARLLWVAIGLVIRNPWVWAGEVTGGRWTPAAVRWILMLDVVMAFTRPASGRSNSPPSEQRT